MSGPGDNRDFRICYRKCIVQNSLKYHTRAWTNITQSDRVHGFTSLLPLSH